MDPNKRIKHQEEFREAARVGRREYLVFKATLPACFILTLMKYVVATSSVLPEHRRRLLAGALTLFTALLQTPKALRKTSNYPAVTTARAVLRY